MVIPDAGLVIGVGVSLFGAGVAAHLGIDAWIRLKRFEREERARQAPLRQPDPATDARLARIEQIVEVTSLEVERIAESQRYVAMALAEQQQRAIGPVRSPERVITPH